MLFDGESEIDKQVWADIFSLRRPDPALPCAPAIVLAMEQETAPGWCCAARELAAQGLLKSADMAFRRAAALLDLAADRAEVLDSWAALLRQLGWTEAAERCARVVRRLRNQANTDRRPELEAEGYVLCRANDPAGFAAALAMAAENPLESDPLRGETVPRLSTAPPLERDGGNDDLTFVVMDEAGPLILVACAAAGDGMILHEQCAVALTPLVASPPDWAVHLALRQLHCVAKWADCWKIWFEGRDCAIEQAWMATWPGQPAAMGYAEIDLTQPLEVIRRGYRETHRQQVAWGRKSLRVEAVSDPALIFDGLVEMYGDAGLHPQFTLASLGQAGVAIFAAWVDQDLVSVVVTVDAGSTTYYALAARKHGIAKPLGHVLVDAAIADAQMRGQKLFSFGCLYLDETAAPKQKGITGFKRGFVRQIRPCTWTHLWV